VTTELDVDLASPDTFAEGIPHEFFARKRREEPVFWHPERPPNSGFWAVTRYDDLVTVHKEWETFSSELGHVSLEELQPDELEVRRSMLETDPPRHTRLRRIVSPLFTPRAVGRYEDYARELAREVLDRALGPHAAVGEAGAAPTEIELEMLSEIAEPFPINVLVRILGAPPEDAPRLVGLGDRMIANTDPDYSDAVVDREDTTAYRLLPFRSPAALELFEYGDWLARERRREPRDDLVSKLVQAEVDGDRLSDREFSNFFTLLVIAGNETTRQTLAHAAVALAEHPDELAKLRGDLSLLRTTAVEEIIRWATPVLQFRRTATRDTELNGSAIRRGDKVVMWYVSANFDEDVFPDPYRFDLTREPNDQASFGSGGPHFCLGAYLARLEVRVMLEELLPRISAIELTDTPRRIRSNFVNGFKQVPLRLRFA
jgi:cytochrome P450